MLLSDPYWKMMRNAIWILFVLCELISAEDNRDMVLALDHVYICAEKDAPEAKLLQDAGLLIAPDTVHHTGQGTASVFFYFGNSYLELIWLDNSVELKAADQKLATKFKMASDGGSPFGIGLRRCDPSNDSLPFETTSYYADWMKPGTSIEIVKIDHENEPEIFVMPPYMGWDQIIERNPDMLSDARHPIGLQALTRIRVCGPDLPTESRAQKYLLKKASLNLQTPIFIVSKWNSMKAKKVRS